MKVKAFSAKSQIMWIVVTAVLLLVSWVAYRLIAQPSEPKRVIIENQQLETVEDRKIRLTDDYSVAPIPGKYNTPESFWVVVSKDYPISDQGYKPAELSIPDVPGNNTKSDEERSVRKDIVPFVEKMFADAKSAGHEIMIASGFRSYELQNYYYSNYVRASGETEANKYSAKPGQSEHQTGLAMDISLTNRTCYLEVCFRDTPAGAWLSEHAHEYGFVLRYPENKTDATKYQFEPWHFRYVGEELANILYTSGLTLDEIYPALLKAQQ